MFKARIGILGVITTQISVYLVISNTQGSKSKTFLEFAILMKLLQIPGIVEL